MLFDWSTMGHSRNPDLARHHPSPRPIGPLQSIQHMIHVRRVCKAWRSWVDESEDWIQGVQLHLERYMHSRGPWSDSQSKFEAARKCVVGPAELKSV
jgi:hypothetical protein